MQKYNLGNCQVELDRELTLNWYEKSDGWACECGHCRNFLTLAKNKELPKHIVDILDELGILPEKATYVCELYTDDVGVHYQFSYRIAGTIIDTDNSGEVCCRHEPYPYGAPNFPTPHFDLDFCATLPWVLNEPQK